MNNKYLELRKKYKKFIYHNYEVIEDSKNINITYNFEIEGLESFTPKWSFKKTEFYEKNKKNSDYIKLIDNVIFNLGMIEVVSYYKPTCSEYILVECASLNKKAIDFFKKIYVNGLGEFFYINNIVEEMNKDTFVSIESTGESKKCIDLNLNLKGNLVPVGGGKDSALTLEVLNDKKDINTPYSINTRDAIKLTIQKAGYDEKDRYISLRTLDKRLIELNEKGFLNGHTPFSAIVAFSSLLSALITGKKYIVLSNEFSANEVNVLGTDINHQYSKSLEFENDFREYVNESIGKNIPEYFSLLRPLNEFEIVREFAKKPKYFEVFKSCNVGSKKDIWCLNCAKCLYVYIMLFAVTRKDVVDKVFKEDLLNKKSLYNIFMGLVNPDLNKPFECVGTKDEINLSINIIIDKYNENQSELPYLLNQYITETNLRYKNTKEFENAKNKISTYWNINNNLNEEFKNMLKDYIAK